MRTFQGRWRPTARSREGRLLWRKQQALLPGLWGQIWYYSKPKGVAHVRSVGNTEGVWEGKQHLKFYLSGFLFEQLLLLNMGWKRCAPRWQWSGGQVMSEGEQSSSLACVSFAPWWEGSAVLASTCLNNAFEAVFLAVLSVSSNSL